MCKYNEKSDLALHVTNTSHSIDFDNVHILNTEKHTKKREFLEMLYIHAHQNTLNRITDTASLKSTYKNMVKEILKHTS